MSTNKKLEPKSLGSDDANHSAMANNSTSHNYSTNEFHENTMYEDDEDDDEEEKFFNQTNNDNTYHQHQNQDSISNTDMMECREFSASTFHHKIQPENGYGINKEFPKLKNHNSIKSNNKIINESKPPN